MTHIFFLVNQKYLCLSRFKLPNKIVVTLICIYLIYYDILADCIGTHNVEL